MSWKSFLKDYFIFSRAERYGVLGLCSIILSVLIIRLLLPQLIKTQVPDTSAFADEITQFRLAISSPAYASERAELIMNEQIAVELFFFDPNSATNEEFERLGFNERQIRNIRNYQASGGSFRRREDLQRLFTISATQYQRLEPYIRIATNVPTVRTVRQAVVDEVENIAVAPRAETRLIIELNTADSSLLTQLPGIGPVLAARTVRYRNLIGGFTDVAQLSEVFGINQDLVERLAPQLSVDSSLIRKMPVNTITLNALMRHPYLNEQQARGIINYRRLQNRINNVDELVRNNILEREAAERIKPYLSFE